MTKTVIKRDGRVVPFDIKKIEKAIWKAAESVGEENKDLTPIVKKVEQQLKGKSEIPVEEIQDLIEQTLMEFDEYKISKAFILYRQKRAEVRKVAASLGVKDSFHLPLNSILVLASRYLLRNSHGEIVETPKQLFERVAKTVAEVDRLYGATDEEVKQTEKEFYDAITNFEFMPNSPTLMNAGTQLGQLSACFVLPIGDSIQEIFDAVKNAALVHKTGGGTGFSFSNIRPNGDVVKSTGGIASGPVSFMKVFDIATQAIKQGGKRRGANMAVLKVTHPDILDFITSKTTEGEIANFNISVGVTDQFMKAVEKDDYIWLINPRTGKRTKRIKARQIWDLMVIEAWKTGDPGVLFLDTINNSVSNCIPKYGPIEATNPCGEVPLYSWEPCNLGSINLSKMVKKTDDTYEIDWEKLKKTVELGVHFLDNIIDANKYPLPEIEKMAKAGRRIGLGVMGFADMLILLGIPYNSEEAIKVAEQVMSTILLTARQKSMELAEQRGDFPEFKNSVWYKEKGYKHLRNCAITTIAPTGTISIIAGGCSSGIEPLFAVAYTRHVGETLGTSLLEVNQLFERIAIKEGFYTEDLFDKISRSTSIKDVKDIPLKIRKLFVTAHDIDPSWHVRMQAVFQKYTDNAVSKTINFPESASPRQIEEAFWLAYKLGCKGITVYRDKCKKVQVLSEVRVCQECAV